MNTYYFDASGRCVCIANVELPADGLDLGMTAVYDEADLGASDIYLLKGGICQRPANPSQLTGMTIVDIPQGSTVEIEGQSYTVDDGVAELSFSLPGPYVVRVLSFPALDAVFEVTA